MSEEDSPVVKLISLVPSILYIKPQVREEKSKLSSVPDTLCLALRSTLHCSLPCFAPWGPPVWMALEGMHVPASSWVWPGRSPGGRRRGWGVRWGHSPARLSPWELPPASYALTLGPALRVPAPSASACPLGTRQCLLCPTGSGGSYSSLCSAFVMGTFRNKPSGYPDVHLPLLGS